MNSDRFKGEPLKFLLAMKQYTTKEKHHFV